MEEETIEEIKIAHRKEKNQMIEEIKEYLDKNYTSPYLKKEVFYVLDKFKE